MSKIKIFTKLDSPDEKVVKEFKGILNNNKLVYTDDSVKTTIVLNDDLLMTRENDDYKFEFIFKDKSVTKGYYTLKMYNTSMDLEIKTYKLEINENFFKVEYELLIDDEDKQKFIFELNYEII